jgi:hypothetical protein
MKTFKLTLAGITAILFLSSLSVVYQIVKKDNIDSYIVVFYFSIVILTIIELANVDNYETTNINSKLISLFLTLFPFCFGTILVYGFFNDYYPSDAKLNFGFERDFYFPTSDLILIYGALLIIVSINDFYIFQQDCIKFYKEKYKKEIGTKYYYADGSKQFGPFTLSVLRNKNLSRETYVWTESMTEWKKIKDIPDLNSEIASSLPPPLPPN